jgi:hypothetical protein
LRPAGRCRHWILPKACRPAQVPSLHSCFDIGRSTPGGQVYLARLVPALTKRLILVQRCSSGLEAAQRNPRLRDWSLDGGDLATGRQRHTCVDLSLAAVGRGSCADLAGCARGWR